MSENLPATTLPAAGWFPDPENKRQKRYWNGSEWASSLSPEQRQGAMALAVSDAVKRGWRVESQTDTQAVIVIGHRPNHLLHFVVTVFTLGLWLIPWIIISLSGGEKRKTLTITPEARAIET